MSNANSGRSGNAAGGGKVGQGTATAPADRSQNGAASTGPTSPPSDSAASSRQSGAGDATDMRSATGEKKQPVSKDALGNSARPGEKTTPRSTPNNPPKASGGPSLAKPSPKPSDQATASIPAALGGGNVGGVPPSINGGSAQPGSTQRSPRPGSAPPPSPQRRPSYPPPPGAPGGVGGVNPNIDSATGGNNKFLLSDAVRSAKQTVADAAGRGPRRARLQLKKVDPWSVMKFSFAASLVLFIAFVVATAVLYTVLDAVGVFDSINETIKSLTTSEAGESGSGFVIDAKIVIGGSALLGAVNMVLFTALATLGAFVYNICSDLAGGIEVTLAERE